MFTFSAWSPILSFFFTHHHLMQPRFHTNRWHCGVRVTATFPTTSSENCSKRWRSAAMDMRKRDEAMENWNEGCRLHQKAYSVTKLLHKTTNISLKVRDTIPSWKDKSKNNSNQPKHLMVFQLGQDGLSSSCETSTPSYKPTQHI